MRPSAHPSSIESPPRLSAGRAVAAAVLPGTALCLVAELVGATFATENGAMTFLERGSIALAYDAAVVSAFLAALWGLTNRLGFALLTTTALLFTATFFNVRKVQLLGLPLLPWDFVHFRQVTSLLPALAFDVPSVAGLALAVALGLACVLLPWGAPRHPLPAALRGVAVGSLAAVLAVLPLRHTSLGAKAFSKAGIAALPWSHLQTWRLNGLPLLMLLNTDALTVKRPSGYGREAVADALPRVFETADEAPPTDVILVLAESLWDPTQLGVGLSRDPMPFLRSLSTDFPSGSMTSPVFGGGTANAEFELLSGVPTAFLPEGAFAYQHFVTRPVETLASVLRDRGWQTASVHPFHRWFWSRDVVYPRLGIDRLEGLEAFQDARYTGPWVSDETFVDSVLERVPDEGPPGFLFAISMATHGTYLYARAEDELVEVEETLEPLLHHELANYVNAVAKFDVALEQLVRTLENRSRRTLVVVFGDHLPVLGPDFAIYRQAGYFGATDTPEQQERKATVQVWTWANYPLPRLRIEGPLATLTPRVLAAAGVPRSPWWALVEEMGRTFAVLRRDLVRTHDGRTFANLDEALADPEVGAVLERYRLLAYDRVFGEAWSMEADAPTTLVAGVE